MLNYNLNIIEPNNAGRRRFLLSGEVNYNWYRSINVASGPQSGSIIFATGSIAYVPYAPTTLFVSGTYDSNKIGSGVALGLPVNISVTGSGVWPTTGSNTLSIVVGGNLGFNLATSSILSAAMGNMNLSGSKISASFSAVGNQTYNIDFGVSHTKGNIYNPLVKWKTQNTSPLSTTTPINGNTTASFNIVKDVNVPLVYVKEVTSSFNSQFNYEYNFGVTASLTASIENNITGSTTMSLLIPEAGVNKVEKYFNWTSAGNKIITGSFAATTDSTYTITASVEYNKGNLSNSGIGWSASGSGNTPLLAMTASFTINKDAVVNMANVPNMLIPTASEYTNDYAFNQTASISLNYTPYYTGSASQSYVFAQSNLIIPELSVNISSNITGSALTASFEAQTNVSHYSITASAIAYKTTRFDYLVVGGGGAGGKGTIFAGGGGGGAGAAYSGSVVVPATSSYIITVGTGGVGSLDQVPPSTTGSFGSASKIEGYSSIFDDRKFFIVSASGGRGGEDGISTLAGSFGQGGNGANTGKLDFYLDNSINFSISASGGTGSPRQNQNRAGGGGGAGSYNNGTNGNGVGTAGTGGDGLTWSINGITYAAGGGGGASGVISGGGPGGTGGGGKGGNFGNVGGVGAGSPATNYGSGGGGGGTLGASGANTSGAGYQGIVIISYIGSGSIATGGTITYDSGSNRMFHTFTSNGIFTILPERL